MANMRDIRVRMKSIRQTLQITSAMKLISTSKLRRARVQLNQTEPYFDRIQETMEDIFMHSEDIREQYFAPHERSDGVPRRGFMVITSDKGLAGGYNHNIIKLAETSMTRPETDYLLLLGTIGSRYFLRKNCSILENYKYSTVLPTVFDAKDVADFILSQYEHGVIDEFYIVYTRMYSSVKLVPEVLKILPLEEMSFRKGEAETMKSDSSLTYIPSAQAVLETLIPKYLSGVIYGAMVESFASEHSARMTAMDNASKNAQEMLDKLQLVYNRSRQSAITQEVTEIVAGAAALNV
jgi:F-type H+-transporting ATPase subunit gamma